MTQKDFLYLDNKHVKQGEIKFDKNYLRKLWITRIINVLLFVSIVSIGIYFVTSSGARKVAINNVSYNFDKVNKEIDVEDKIIFSTNKLGFFSKNLRINLTDTSSVGKVISLPLSTIELDNEQIYLHGTDYAIECIDGSCKPGEIIIISKNTILGMVTEDVPSE